MLLMLLVTMIIFSHSLSLGIPITLVPSGFVLCSTFTTMAMIWVYLSSLWHCSLRKFASRLYFLALRALFMGIRLEPFAMNDSMVNVLFAGCSKEATAVGTLPINTNGSLFNLPKVVAGLRAKLVLAPLQAEARSFKLFAASKARYNRFRLHSNILVCRLGPLWHVTAFADRSFNYTPFALLVLCFMLSSQGWGAFNSASQWDVRSTAAASNINGGGFVYGLGAKDVTAATDLVVNSSNNLVVTSATHNFVAGDVKKYINVTAGTNWVFGWYQIISTASNAATLDVSPAPVGTTGGTYDLYSAIDYSQQDAAQIAFTDIVIGVTTTQGTSVLHPFTADMVGNVVNVLSGASCTVQRAQIISLSGVTATFDKSLGTAAASCTGNLGGSFLTVVQAALTMAGGNTIHIKSGTYSGAVTWTITAGEFIGYGTTHRDGGTKPLITIGTSAQLMVDNGGGLFNIKNISFSNTAVVPGVAFYPQNANNYWFDNCVFDGFSYALFGDNSGRGYFAQLKVTNTEIKNGFSGAILDAGAGILSIIDSWIHDNVGDALNSTGAKNIILQRSILSANTRGLVSVASSEYLLFNSIIANHTSDGLVGSGAPLLTSENSIIYGNGGFGFSLPFATTLTDFRNNAYGSNTSGNAANGMSQGTEVLKLTANPFTTGAAQTLSFGPHNMTTNSLPTPFVADQSLAYLGTFLGFKAFDGSASAAWVANTTTTSWISLDIGSGNSRLLTGYRIQAEPNPFMARTPKTFTIEGSNNNSTWTTLDSPANQTGWTASESRSFTIASPGSTYYRYFRVNITANDGDGTYTSIAEMNWYGNVSGTTQSTNFALNNTAGGGAVLKLAGFPGVFPGGASTGYLDVGPVQTSGSPGAGGAYSGAFIQ